MLLHHRAHVIVAHDRVREDIEQFLRALVAAADRLDNRHADGIFKLAQIDVHAALLRLVLHVEVDEQRNALLEQLNREEEVTLDV